LPRRTCGFIRRRTRHSWRSRRACSSRRPRSRDRVQQPGHAAAGAWRRADQRDLTSSRL
jgi:hypothetical protein